MFSRPQISLMSIEQLEEHIRYLGESSRSELVWMSVAGSDHGKPILKWLKEERELTRSRYRSIVPHDQAMVTILAGLQADERRLDDMIALIENSEKRKNTVDEELEYARECLHMKQKLSREQR